MNDTNSLIVFGCNHVTHNHLHFTHADSCLEFHELCERIFVCADFTAAKLCQYDVESLMGFIFTYARATFHCLSDEDGTPKDL